MTPLEAALLDVLDAQGVPVVVRAADGAVTYANAAARALGWDAPGAATADATMQSLSNGDTLVLRRPFSSGSAFFEARDNLHNTIAHDLLTPVGVVDGFAELLAMSVPSDPELQMYSERVRVGTGRLILLSRLVSPYAWLATGLPLNSMRVDVGQLLDAVLLAVAGRARDRAVMLEMRDADHSPVVLADAPFLFLVLEQVIVNGLLYSEPGQSVTVRVAQTGDQVELTVQDQGIGIPAEELPHVFDRNTRGSDPRVQAVSGAGYGLTVAKLAIERMGGQISLESAPGVGTTVTLKLQAADGPHA
jgi:signal transduction histidine kinase